MIQKLLCLIILLTTLQLASHGQESEPEDQNFHFIEAGAGVSYEEAAISFSLSNSLNTYMANFIDYNMGFDKSNIKNHEVSFKIGPYLRFNTYSYLAISTGLSYHMGQSKTDWIYTNGIRNYLKEHLISIPIQAKINFEMKRGFSFGLKGTINKLIDKNKPDRGTAMMYLGYAW